MEFLYNDGGRKEAGKKGHTRDCVCRAISIATNSPYDITYKLLNLMSKKDGGFSNARTGMYDTTYRPFLFAYGWKYVELSVRGIANWELIPKSGIYIVKCHRHISAVIDGVINDTWNPAAGKHPGIYGYYTSA